MKIFCVGLLLCFLATMICTVTSMSNEKICSLIKTKTNFSCKNRDGELLIQLSAYIQILKTLRDTIKITCYQNHPMNLKNLPYLELNEIKYLDIKGCPLKNQSILSDIKNHLNLNNILNLSLEMQQEQGKKISSHFFQHYEKVENLRLLTAKNDHFIEDAFVKFKNLKDLILDAFDLTKLPQNLFVKLSNLASLRITSKNEEKYEKITEKTFSLSFKGCTSLKKFSIVGMKGPIRMNLHFDRLIESIEIKNNQKIIEINSDAFKYAEQIDVINLSNNSIKSFNPDIFKWQKQLTFINLSRNIIETINATLFKHNKQLGEIDLSYNRIFFIERNAFSNQHFLKKLKLEYNNLNDIDLSNFFGAKLHILQYFSVFNNNLSRIDGELPSESRMRRIDFRNNKLSRFFIIQFWLKSSKNLTILLENNILESIDFRDIYDGNYETQGSLIIDLGKTPIICNCYTIPLYEFMKKKIQISKWIYDKIKINPNNVKCKKFSKNSPKMVTSIIPEKTLCPLDSSPHYSVCPTKCCCMRRPMDKTLIIECENITTVPTLPPYKPFKDILITKINLFISRNNIRNLPKTLDVNYNDVTEIHASYNFIEYISEYNLPKRLELLDLKNNLLKTIHPKVLEKFANFKALFLSQNPWNCSSAYTVNLIKFVKNHRTIVKDFQTLRCTDGKYFLEIEDERFCNSYVIMTIIFTSVSFLVIFVIFVIYHNKTIISEWIFENDRYHIVEKLFNYLKPLDVCILCTRYDKVFGNYIGSKLIRNPNSFKCCLVIKSWNSDKIPPKDLIIFKKSRRIIIILSEYFNENDWKQWSYANINSRIVFITKENIKTDDIKIKNKSVVKFNDPLFWDKLRHSLIYCNEMEDNSTDQEVQLLTEV